MIKQIASSLALFAALLLTTTNAEAARFRPGYTCHDLRAMVTEYGSSFILASARSRGFSELDIAHIRRKCRV